MATPLPVPIEFQLPERWRPAEPDVLGAPSAAYVALRPEPAGDFVANITVSGELDTHATPLSDYADVALRRLQQGAPDAKLTKRAEAGSDDAPGLTQVARMSTDVNGAQRELVQIHVFLAMPDAAEPGKRAIIELVLTTAEEELDEVVADFREFVGSVAPHAGEAAAAADAATGEA